MLCQFLSIHVNVFHPFIVQLSPSEHIWLPSMSNSSSASVDTECYLGEKDCEKFGEKRRCAACHIVAHTACFPFLAKVSGKGQSMISSMIPDQLHASIPFHSIPFLQMNLTCKSTYRDCSLTTNSTASHRRRHHSKDAQDALNKHHWVHRWRLEGRCFHCGKSFQQKMFREKVNTTHTHTSK